jgi:hypothetical protein
LLDKRDDGDARQHQLALPIQAAHGQTGEMRTNSVILGLKDEAIEAELVAGRISCGCGGRHRGVSARLQRTP